jgi:hypothetical protein
MCGTVSAAFMPCLPYSLLEPTQDAPHALNDCLLYLAMTAACCAADTNIAAVRHAMTLLHLELAGRAGCVALGRQPWLRAN